MHWNAVLGWHNYGCYSFISVLFSDGYYVVGGNSCIVHFRHVGWAFAEVYPSEISKTIICDILSCRYYSSLYNIIVTWYRPHF